MINTVLRAAKDGRELANHAEVDGTDALGIMTYGMAHGHFNSEISTANETIIIIPARGSEAFSLTDILIQTSKTNGGTVTLSITDDTYTETLVSGTFAEAPLSVALSVSGRMESWQGCRLELITDSTAGNHTVTCTVGYFRASEEVARSYSVWNAQR